MSSEGVDESTTSSLLAQQHSAAENIEEWLTLCSVNDRFAALFADKATRGELARSGLRAVLWKWRLLTHDTTAPWKATLSNSNSNSNSAASKSAASSVSAWLARQRAAREHYARLQQQYLVDPHAAEHASFDPLSNADSSPWNEYFENAELEREIEQDVLRTYPEHAYFRAAAVQTQLRRILLVYAREQPHVQYKQGMHELLAPILFVFAHQALAPDAAAAVDAAARAANVPSYASLLDPAHVEADAFAAFHGLMSLVQEWFVSPPRRTASAPASAADSRNVVVDKCEAIQSRLLRLKDAELCAHLESLHVLPQLYMLRWLRCMFGREFHLEDTLRIWDALFASDRPIQLVDQLCVAMLRYVREQLLAADNAGCLHRLKSFPPVENVGFLVELAVKQLRGEPTALDAPPPTAAAAAVAPGSDPLSASVVELASAALQTTRSLFSAATKSSSAAADAPASKLTAAPKEQQQQSTSSSSSALPTITDAPVPTRAMMDHMASRIERICHSLQTEMRENPVIQQNETLMFALAELKQVRDVLAGRLPA